MSAFNAAAFRAHLDQFGGASQNNYFDVVIVLPNFVWSTESENVLKFRAHMADMPARNLETLDRRYAGPMRNIPVGHTYTTLQLGFIESGDRATRKIFDAWQSAIMDTKSGWDVPYYKDIIAPHIELRLYNKASSHPAAIYRFYECFPVTIGPSQLSWENKNQLLTIPIEIAYHRWENEAVAEPVEKTLGGLLGTIQSGVKSFRDIVTTVNDINTQYRTAKSQVKQAKKLFSDIKKLKINTNSFGGFAESLGNIDRTIGKVGSTANDIIRGPIFSSNQQTTKKPTPKF